jgi:hypothetical protein
MGVPQKAMRPPVPAAPPPKPKSLTAYINM